MAMAMTIAEINWKLKRPLPGKVTQKRLITAVSNPPPSHCPSCDKRIFVSARTKKMCAHELAGFDGVENWLFYGEKGKRWVVCQGDGFLHFRADVGRGKQHRLWVEL